MEDPSPGSNRELKHSSTCALTRPVQIVHLRRVNERKAIFRQVEVAPLPTTHLERLDEPQPRGLEDQRIIFPMTKSNILELLKGGDRRSIGRADEVAAAVSRNSALFSALMKGWWSQDPLVRMRTADATEKITRNKPHLLGRYKSELLSLMTEAKQQELRWHLAAMVPRLRLDVKELRVVCSLLRSYLEDDSSIVKTSALQALADLASDQPSIQPEVMELLRQSVRNGTFCITVRHIHEHNIAATIAVLCFSMGLQNAMITKLSRHVIRTTHLTGMVTDIGSAVEDCSFPTLVTRILTVLRKYAGCGSKPYSLYCFS